ncbi:hypothetical protein QJS10_CPB17g02327 [Acorus calamus]|uniref:Uncharacterized protein n=1 Tax=Acorus calamus TaxID=4465 RepID=A0AAV9CY60_ACOCL|nr:hypothetical protein QJS10_CPB17g02327 [Acorus calamus]
MGVAAAARASNTQNPTRPPLIPSEKDNAAPLRRPKSKLISSRYMTSSSTSTSSTSSSSTTSSNSSSRRCSSPLVTRSTPPETHSAVRSLSADRRRPEPRAFNNAGPGDVSVAARVLKTSVRTLSVSFQGESFALPVSKTKAAPATPSASAFASSRKLTPERRRSASPHVENSRPSQSSDQQLRRWPRIVSRDLGVLTRSLDFTADLKRGGSLKLESRKSFDGRLWPSLGSDNSCDLSSDSESVSSGAIRGFMNRAVLLGRLGDPTDCPNRPGPFVTPPWPPGKTPLTAEASNANTDGLTISGDGEPIKDQGSGFCEPQYCRTRKMGKSQVEELHLSKIYYNGHLQWRFANARAEEAMAEQMKTAEMTHLEEWAIMDRDHSSSLSGTVDAMRASTLRLPVVDGAMTDIQKLKDASASAIDVMQAIASSTRFVLSKIENLNTLVTEIAGVATQERALLDHCGYLLSTMTAMQNELSGVCFPMFA